jgi:hypothetical protein
MSARHVLLVLSLVTLQAGALAQAPAPSAAAGDANVAASIRDALAKGKLTRIEGGDYKVDRPIVLPTGAAAGKMADAEVLYQIGVSSKDNSGVFLPVRISSTDSAETAKRLDEVLKQLQMPSPDGHISACSGERTCSKVCKNDGGEYCCKWKCEKSKQ